jgi:hypothetical protein
MSYYTDKTTPTVKFLHRRKKELEYKLLYWTKLVDSKTRERALVFIRREMRQVHKFLQESENV